MGPELCKYLPASASAGGGGGGMSCDTMVVAAGGLIELAIGNSAKHVHILPDWSKCEFVSERGGRVRKEGRRERNQMCSSAHNRRQSISSKTVIAAAAGSAMLS